MVIHCSPQSPKKLLLLTFLWSLNSKRIKETFNDVVFMKITVHAKEAIQWCLSKVIFD